MNYFFSSFLSIDNLGDDDTEIRFNVINVSHAYLVLEL